MSFPRPRILIVDHDVDNCEMLPIWLDPDQDRYDITTTYSCREARELTIKTRFDAYILDYLMPDMTGADLCAVLRKLDSNAPIIMYTGMSTREARENSFRSGADLFLLKPDDMELLAPAVDDLLSHRARSFIPRPHRRIRHANII